MTIFKSPDDYSFYCAELNEALSLHGGYLGAFCLMPNHIHLFIKRGPEPLATIFHRLHSRFSRYFNVKYRRYGHVFQGRYHSFWVGDDAYAQQLVGYIHQNPIRAKIVRKVSQYKWSSDPLYRHDQKKLARQIRVPGIGRKTYLSLIQEEIKGATIIEMAEAQEEKQERRKPGRNAAKRSERRGKRSMNDILVKWSRQSGYGEAELTGPTRSRVIAAVRQAAMREMYHAGHGPVAISRVFNRDSSVIYYALGKDNG